MKLRATCVLLLGLLFKGLSAQFVSTTNTGLGTLMSLAVDPAGNRYVSDRSGNRVIKLDNDNTPTTYCGAGLSDPQDLERGPGGELYVVNNGTGTVSLVPPGGGPATVYASGFSSPRGVTLAPNGDLYVAEYMTQRIYRVAPGGGAVGGPNVTLVVGVAGITGALGGSDRLEDISWEPSGSLVATIGFGTPGRIYRIALPSGAPTLLATSPLITAAFALNVNQQTGNIYVTAIYSHRIFTLTPSGTLTLLTGDGTAATLDGPLASARFNEPAGIAVDPTGNIWITQYNGEVRRIGLQPAEVPVSGLRLWLRADRGLLRSGSTVTQWLDQSGSGNHATPTGALYTPQPPAFVSNVVNGLPAVRFNGVNTGLTTPAFATFPSKRGTIFSVVRVNAPSSTSGGGYGTIAGTYYATSGTLWQYGGYTGQYSFYDGVGGSNFNIVSNPPSTWGIATFLRDADNGFKFYKSGVLVTSGSLANNQPSVRPVHIGWNDFTNPSTWEVLNGDIAELIIYDFALTPAEIEQVNAYLADKYGFNGDVPPPTAQGTSICGSGSATLTATGGDAYRWFDSPTATVPLATTATFTTPVLTSTTTYYVANFNGVLQSPRVPVTVTVQQPGDACDDGDPNTTGDALDGQCQCVGTPIITCTTDLDFVYQADGAHSLTWELREQGTNTLVQSGGGMLSGNGSEATCLPDGCFYLVVTDGGGDGIASGGYLLRINSAQRLIDNLHDDFGMGGFTSGATSQIDANEGFCLPISSDRLIYTSCDKRDWKLTPCGGDYVVANENPAVSALHGGPFAASTGYQMWWYNPNGGYSFKRFQSHNTANGLPAGPTRACHFRINGWSGNQLQEGVFYNVKVRGRIAGVYNNWGAACRFVLNSTEAQCPRTKLMDDPGNQFLSCGQSRQVGSQHFVHARTVKRMLPGCSWQNANRYQFRFMVPTEGIDITKTSPVGQYFVTTAGLPCGKTFQVYVRASFDGGATWCHTTMPWGDQCLFTTTCSFGMATEPGSGTLAPDATLSMYPNPNRGDQLFLRLSGLEPAVNKVMVDLFDGYGKRVATHTLAAQDGYVNSTLELNELANGLYLLNISAGEHNLQERLVIQR